MGPETPNDGDTVQSFNEKKKKKKKLRKEAQLCSPFTPWEGGEDEREEWKGGSRCRRWGTLPKGKKE